MSSRGNLEWTINVSDGTTKVLEPERGLVGRIRDEVRSSITGFFKRIWRFFVEAWSIGVVEPKKFIHCFKVGFALCVVSLFYYMRPLYEGVGGTAMWAIMTVVVAFEYTVGATICKSFNRTVATTLAGSLGLGIHWIASQCGLKYEPIVLGVFIFIFAAIATFSRFIPYVKARFDYGALIFILTFSLISVSGYRVEKLVQMAQERVSTIAIGTSLCILTSMLISPAWAGSQLHNQTITNIEKLANSLEGYVAEYFSSEDSNGNVVPEDGLNKKLLGYKCVLNSKASEEVMANFARWEPSHGRFYFSYPWQQYLLINAAARSCAYCIDNLNTCIDSETQIQTPEYLKQHIKKYCMKLSICSSKVLKEVATTIRTNMKSTNIDFAVDEMNNEVEDLQTALKSLPYAVQQQSKTEKTVQQNDEKLEPPSEASMLDVLSVGTLVTLLIEAVGRIEQIVDAVDTLASIAEFKNQNEKKMQQKQSSEDTETNCHDQEAMKALEKV
ncbi:aluminum-activated malate transporter 10-like [Silene latifolia]|uniref:aluminum-activated malate transporter 10-like n=1 Tax=Silene latifolia TaxID=37657 RepID=UPI003D76E250